MRLSKIDFSNHDLGAEEASHDNLYYAGIKSLSPIKPIYTKSSLKEWLNPNVDIRGIILHHTAAPITCSGIQTIKAIRGYHLNNGFSDIAASFYSSDEKDVIGYSARSLHSYNYAHCYVSKPWSLIPTRIQKEFRYDRMYANKNFFGLETISNFDSQNPKTSVAMRHSILVMATVCEVYNLNVESILPHRLFAYKTCPGENVDMTWIHSEVRKEMNGENCKDQPAHNYAVPALSWAIEKGLIKGDNEGHLMPRCPITREDFIVILKRYDDYLKNN